MNFADSVNSPLPSLRSRRNRWLASYGKPSLLPNVDCVMQTAERWPGWLEKFMPRLLASDSSYLYRGSQLRNIFARDQRVDCFFVVSLRRDRFKKAVKFSGNTADSGGAFAVLFGEIFSKWVLFFLVSVLTYFQGSALHCLGVAVERQAAPLPWSIVR